MTEFNSNSFLIELDSFGKPPPPQNIYSKSNTKEIASKLDALNREKQMKMKGDLMAPSGNGMVKLASDGVPKKQQINQEDARRWRDDVLSMSRPRAPFGFTSETAESAREYAQQIRNSTYLNQSDSEDDRTTRSSSASNSLPSPPGEMNYLKIHTDHPHHERKSSDYSSASSHKSPSPPSQSSYSDYASLYKSQTNSPSPRPDSPTKQFNAAFRNTNSVPVVSVGSSASASRFSPVPIKSDPPKPAAPNFGYGPSLTQQIRVTAKPPAGRAPAFGNQREQQRKETWRRIGEESDAQDRRLEELSRQLHQNLVMDKRKVVGNCYHCQKPMYDTEDRYTVHENTYHSKCFTCEVCGKELKDVQFYLSGGRFFCKQDYFTEQMVQQRDTYCAACKTPIQDTILAALNRNFHPRCFRCTDCHCSLDGTPFSADKENQAFCIPCYHNRYAPRCATCKLPITPDKETGETTRIMASKNSYHIECYMCEGCRLVFDDDQKCYPLDGHLLCKTCHLHWARTKNAPITDL